MVLIHAGVQMQIIFCLLVDWAFKVSKMRFQEHLSIGKPDFSGIFVYAMRDMGIDVIGTDKLSRRTFLGYV